MKRTKAVYFPDEKGFILTFGAEDDELFRWAKSLTSEQLREIFGCALFADITRVAGKKNVRGWMRDRLRLASRNLRTPSAASPPLPDRNSGWLQKDLATAARAERLLAEYAPDAASVIDPFAGTGRYPLVAAQRGANAFWCETDPVCRFLATTRFRALFRDDALELPDALRELAERVPELMQRTREAHSSLRSACDAVSGSMLRDLFRAAVVSLLLDDDPVSDSSVADELRWLASHLEAERPMLTFPTIPAEDASDLGAMRSLEAGVLLTAPPVIGAGAAVSSAAESFLGIDSSAERHRGIGAASEDFDLPRGRATSLSRDYAINDLRSLFESPSVARFGRERARAAIERVIDVLRPLLDREPGKALMAARNFAALIRAFTATERQLATNATAIVDTADSLVGGVVIRNDVVLRELLSLFGFSDVAFESTGLRALPTRAADGHRRLEHHVIVMRRTRLERSTRDWAVWA